MGIDFVLGRKIHETVIFDIEIWPTEVQFFARIYPFCFDRRPQLLPKIRSGEVNFIARSSRQSRALQLINISRRSLFRVEISVTRAQKEISDWRCAQFRFDPLRSRRAQIERGEQSVEADHIREVVMKISRTDRDAFVPEPLLDAGVPCKILFRVETKIA